MELSPSIKTLQSCTIYMFPKISLPRLPSSKNKETFLSPEISLKSVKFSQLRKGFFFCHTGVEFCDCFVLCVNEKCGTTEHKARYKII